MVREAFQQVLELGHVSCHTIARARHKGSSSFWARLPALLFLALSSAAKADAFDAASVRYAL